MVLIIMLAFDNIISNLSIVSNFLVVKCVWKYLDTDFTAENT